ncbi:exodeoxyribonuclease I [Vibrio astriarenae]|nr:exodeoxyribonuclease I [Vibrio sp. C7]
MDIILSQPPEALGSLDISFDDERIKPLLFRYRARHYPWTLTETEQQRWMSHCRDYFETRLPDYTLNLENLAHEHETDEHKMRVLKSVYEYVSKLVS